MTNSSGSYRSSRESSFAAFDKLPATARQALANAVFDWATQPILTNWRRGTKGMRTGSEIAARVAEWDAKQIAKDRKRVWGIAAIRSARRDDARSQRELMARQKDLFNVPCLSGCGHHRQTIG